MFPLQGTEWNQVLRKTTIKFLCELQDIKAMCCKPKTSQAHSWAPLKLYCCLLFLARRLIFFARLVLFCTSAQSGSPPSTLVVLGEGISYSITGDQVLSQLVSRYPVGLSFHWHWHTASYNPLYKPNMRVSRLTWLGTCLQMKPSKLILRSEISHASTDKNILISKHTDPTHGQILLSELKSTSKIVIQDVKLPIT